MNSKLPQRPNLDHLRRQAKALLAAIEAGDKDATGYFATNTCRPPKA